MTDNEFTCEICGKSYPHKRRFKDHLNTHAGLRPHSCPLCSATFCTLEAYGFQTKNKHSMTVTKAELLGKTNGNNVLEESHVSMEVENE